jgi:hypothetical protein
LPDKIPYKRSFDGSQLFISNTLNKIWGHGYCVIGAVTFQSCAYVARYVTKKIYGLAAPEHYGDREPEFCRSSNRPGIGASWFIKYADEVARNGFVLINGHKNPVPRYYLKRLERYSATGLLGDPERKLAARFDDVSEVSDFQSALNKVLEVQRAFGELSAEERRKFGDDPQAWVAHLVEEQQKAVKPVEPVEPVESQPVSEAESAQKPASQGD